MTAETRHDRRIRRGRRLWDVLSSGGGFSERMQAPVERLVLENLKLGGGEAVLDVGCGSGSHFETLRKTVGEHGRVVGVDFSPKMVAAAQKRVGQHGWGNVAVVLRDVTRDALGSDEFDAAIATFALSAMPDVPAAVQNVHRALRPGGQLFVLDLRFDTTGTFGAVSWLLDRTYRILAGRSGEDVLAALDDTFQTVEGIMQNGVRRPRSRRWPPIMLVIARKRS